MKTETLCNDLNVIGLTIKSDLVSQTCYQAAQRLAAQQLEISDLKTHVRDANKGARINSILAANVIANREKMRHQFAAQQQRIVELQAFVREREFSDFGVQWDDGDEVSIRRACYYCEYTEPEGHAADCRKAKLLAPIDE